MEICSNTAIFRYYGIDYGLDEIEATGLHMKLTVAATIVVSGGEITVSIHL